MLTAFLRSLDLPKNVIQHDVDGLEHHLSKQTFEQLTLLVQLQETNRLEPSA
jgi:Mn-dependent DtxR family transcriptional regulator